MPLPLPNLDDRSYADLLDEARGLITQVDPGWTDHNPSDPGMALVELFAWLAEMHIFQVDQISDASYWAFLRLLNGPGAPPPARLDAAIRQTMLALREPYRAVTAADYERLAGQVWPTTPAGLTFGLRRLRVRCLTRRALEGLDQQPCDELAPGHISLVVLPEFQAAGGSEQALYQNLKDFLSERRMLTTRLHVVGPQSVSIQLSATLHPQADALPTEVQRAAREALTGFYDWLCGGDSGDGWPFGRAIYTSEVYAQLEQVPGVAYITDVAIRRGPSGSDSGDIELKPYELPAVDVTSVVCTDWAGDAV
jgi:hypothetical protein